SAEDFDLSKLPDALITKIWVYDDETGEEITVSTSVASLKAELKEQVEEHFDQSVGAEWEYTGCSDWQFPDLHEEVPAGGRSGYPGLVDEGKTVGLKLWLDPDQAKLSHQLGCARLFLLRFPDLKKYLLKNPPMEIDTRMMLPLFGETGVGNEEYCLLAAVGTLGLTMPRTEAEFVAAAEKGRGVFHDCAAKLGKWLDQSVNYYTNISAFIEENRNCDSLGESVEDIEQEISWLLRKNFLCEAGWNRISDYPRYFRAIEERIQRIDSQPLARDLDKMDRIAPFVEEWQELLQENADSIPVRDLGYAIEELRVSLFAPGVPTGIKISEKRLSSMLDSFAS
ncbi:MAG: DUF3418 domain-containing protein, partial [Verrucomicrobiales bacterium]|nr:DUF3418 domain-containing protein [Verrucomicrobiales bacterium]